MKFQKCFVVDLDNTIYNWVDAFAPMFRAGVHALSKKSGINESTLLDSFRDLFNARGSLEYRVSSVRELPALAGLNDAEVRVYENHFFGTLNKLWDKNIALYPNVDKFLSASFNNGWQLVAFTNAPMDVALVRLNRLGIAGFFAAIVAPDHAISTVSYTQTLGQTRDLFDVSPMRTTHGFDVTHQAPHYQYRLQPNQMKPSSFGFQLIRDAFSVGSTLVVIGDNIAKDLAPAYATGSTVSIWARFGTNIQPKNLDTLLRVTPWTTKEITQSGVTSIHPDYIADDWMDILRFADADVFQATIDRYSDQPSQDPPKRARSSGTQTKLGFEPRVNRARFRQA